ncbi:MAG: cysteine--tRNA ligase, partial [Williamsia herbipolensis]|nr:cysteine--tRNA ligase [Williamsia herbipolensis]
GIVYDVLRRWLEWSGLHVTHVRNVTDIDDKILTKSADAGRPWWAHAALNERLFSDAYAALGCLPPTIEPRATGHIPQIVELIDELVRKDAAYPADGDVYFDVRHQADYGFLSGQKIDELSQGESDGRRKRDPADFTLWKAAKPGEPYWNSPWGPGRPGWHIECSAMARTYLGDTFDIHGGGLDLVFPHHENEAAQSHGAGLDFARYWMHSFWVTQAGEKMSKSLGNTMTVEAITELVRAIELRYYLLSVHYRSVIEYSAEALQDAAKALRRIESLLQRVTDRYGEVPLEDELPVDFVTAMDDDLAVPRAIAVIHDHVRAGNTALDDGTQEAAVAIAGTIRSMLAVLGLDPYDSVWQGAASARTDEVLAAVVEQLLEERREARAAKDFGRSDAIRDRLAAAGILVEDGASTSTWTIGRS